MLARIRISTIILALSVAFITGCVYDDEPTGLVIGRYNPEPTVSDQRCPVETSTLKNGYSAVPAAWRPPSTQERNWTAIVIHHSATASGNASIFDRWHREKNNWDGVGYDFVIGNGTDSRDGQVEVTFRWRQQRTGAHCKTPGNWANEEAIGICLVGNFNKTCPTPRQLSALRSLVNFLRKRYQIPISRIYGHRTTPGANGTDCPGRYFPLSRFKASLYR